MQRPKEIALALLIAALLAGGALGYATGRYTAAREFAGGGRGAMRHYLASKLDLTPVQTAGLDSILDTRRREMTRLIAPIQPQLDSSRTVARRQIIALLDERQRRLFDELVQRRDSTLGRTIHP